MESRDRREDDFWKGEIQAEIRNLREQLKTEGQAMRELLNVHIDTQGVRLSNAETRLSILEAESRALAIKVAALAAAAGAVGAKIWTML